MEASQVQQKKPPYWLVVLLILPIIVGCGGVYGNFVYDEAVDEIFEAPTVLPQHNYYFSGPESRPRAIIAIDNGYTLASKLWKPVAMTTAQLNRWVKDPSRRALLFPYTFGRIIQDDKGRRVGVWYSLYDYREFATILMLDETTVQVSTPIDEGYRRHGLKSYWGFADDD